MGSDHHMGHVTQPRLREVKTHSVVVSTGSAEQHGQRLPIDTDAALVTQVTEDLTGHIDDAVLPTLNCGYESRPLSGGGSLFPGTIDVDGITIITQMHDALNGLITDNFIKIVVISAHLENEAFITEAIDLVTCGTGGIATIVETNWWGPIPQLAIGKVFDGLTFPGQTLKYVAVTETSLILHYAPKLVHMDRTVEEAGAVAKLYVRYPVRQDDVPAHSGLASPVGPDAERGRLIAEAHVGAVVGICAGGSGE